MAAWQGAHTRFIAAGRAADAARCAFWTSFAHLLRGEQGPADGWSARAERCVEEAGPDCPAVGLVLVPVFLGLLEGGDATRALHIAEDMLVVGRRTGDQDVLGFGLLCSGEALVACGRPGEGMRCLDEAMVAVTAGELSPIAAGIVYSAVIETCVDAFELRRAAEWTGPRSIAGARRGPASFPSAVSASCTGLRSCRPGARGSMLSRRPTAPANGWRPAPTRRLAPPSTSSASCTGSVASWPRPRTPTGEPAATGATPNRASRCSGSPLETCPPPSLRSSAPSRAPMADETPFPRLPPRSTCCSRRARRRCPPHRRRPRGPRRR